MEGFTKETGPERNSEQALIQALDAKGIEDQGTKESLSNWAAEQERVFEAKYSDDPNRAHFECALAMARLYAQTEKYKEYAIESLRELLEGAHTVSETAEQEITELLQAFRT